MPKSIHSLACDSLACAICGDFESAAPKSGSSNRPIARFSASIIFAIVLVLAVVFISAKSSQVATQRQVGDHGKLKSLLLNKNASFCPCAKTLPLFNESRVQFYLLEKTPSGDLESTPMNNGSDRTTFCEKFGMQNIIKECNDSINYCFGRPGGNIGFQASQLVNENWYSKTIVSEMQAFCTNRVSYNKLLIRTNTSISNDESIHDQLMNSLFAVLSAFQKSPNDTSDEYYWDAPSIYDSNPETPTLLKTQNIAFKMTSNYGNFVEECDPRYCDLVTYVTLWRRIITSVAQVGGVLTIALAALRLLIWPSLVKLFALDKK